MIDLSDNPPLPRPFAALFFLLTLCLMLFAATRPGYPESSGSLRLAAIFSLTGEASASNHSSVLGTRLAVDEINIRGGLLGRNLQLIFLDNMSTPIGSVLAANQAATAGVIGIIGAQWSSHSLAIARVAQENRIPMISNFSTHPGLTPIGPYIYRVCYTDDFQGRVMAEFAHDDLGAKTATVFVDLTSDYSLVLSQIFQTRFRELGGRVVREIEYKAKNKHFHRLIPQATAAPVDVMFLSGHQESAVIALKLQEKGVSSHFMGGDGWGDEIFLTLGGNRLKQGFFCTHWSDSSDRPQAGDFMKKYRLRKHFGTGAALAYDAVMVLARAVREAGSVDGPKVSGALTDMPPYEGVTGTIKFNANGDPVKSAVIMEIRNGVPRYLKTFIPKPKVILRSSP